ncbi:hypothetical protein EYF80_031813 [Liparis tanakae]|uniref:Uncharacterized protein n=1 Tax=Liparis tanakae TaxID=230148 RepID=A0A4Z2GX20_9TELE|nr:hypothetical protein EYF80_031813 [Liparis tanakae]
MAFIHQTFLYLDNVAELGEQRRQGAGVVVLQAEAVAEGLAVLREQLADGEAGVLLRPEQLDQLSGQSLDALHFRQRLRDATPYKRVCETHHHYVWDRLEELQELGEAVVAELALATEVMVVRRDELAEGHSAVRLVAKEVHHLLAKLFGALDFLHCALCRYTRGNS